MKPNNAYHTHQAHDHLFASTMSDQRVAKSFFQVYLPPKVLAATDLDQLKLKRESFVDKKLRKKITDILYTAPIANKPGYIYLLVEHQSTPDKLMPFRLMSYVMRIIEHHVKDQKHSTLPIVVPMVFYTGKKPYCYSTDIFNLFDDPAGLAKEIFLQPFTLIDISQLDDDTLKQQPYSGWLALITKHIRSRAFLENFESILKQIAKIMTDHDDKLVDTLLEYSVQQTDKDDHPTLIQLVADLLSPQHGEKVMASGQTIYEYAMEQGLKDGMQQGMQQGIEQGMQEGKELGLQLGKEQGLQLGKEQATRAVAQRLLNEGVALEVITKTTGLSRSQLEPLISEVN